MSRKGSGYLRTLITVGPRIENRINYPLFFLVSRVNNHRTIGVIVAFGRSYVPLNAITICRCSIPRLERHAILQHRGIAEAGGETERA